MCEGKQDVKYMLVYRFTSVDNHLNSSISRPCDKPLIPGLYSDGPHPAKVTTDDLPEKNKQTTVIKHKCRTFLLSVHHAQVKQKLKKLK